MSDAATDLLRDLVGFDTTSALSNLPLIDYVRDYLNGHGIAATLVSSDDGTKANLYATLGPEQPGGVVLSGHTDVVPVADQDWASDPFTLRAGDGRLYGRGTTDMKGFIAVALALVPAFLRRDLKRPIHLAFSYDEEIGCLGIPGLLSRLGADLPQPAYCVVGEPTGMKVATSHKGVATFETTVTGVPAHSSSPQFGVSATAYAARIVAHLLEVAERLAAQPEPESGFTPPVTTLNVGRLDGGTALNILAGHCTIGWELRPLPGTDAQALAAEIDAHIATEILPRIRAEHADANIVTKPREAIPPLTPDPRAAEWALALSGQNDTIAVPYGAEAGLFQSHGIATVLCGPGDVAQAHQPNEYVETAQLDACEAFLKRVGDWAARGTD